MPKHDLSTAIMLGKPFWCKILKVLCIFVHRKFFFLSLKLDIHNEVKELIRNRDINAPLDEESVYTPIEWAVANGNFTMPFFFIKL